MIDVTINLPDSETVMINNLSKGSVQQILDAVKMIYPTWTSIVIVLTRSTVES